MERKLASIKKIDKIEKIPNSDRIELAIIGGWKVVVAKDVGHKIGDLVVYCEIDSFLPLEPEFEFLRKSSYKKMADGTEGFRLRTIKLRGQVSQGLILPLQEVHNIVFRNSGMNVGLWEGLDVTEMLGITKYDPPVHAELEGKVKGNFPSFIPKTDEERVQNLSKEYTNYKYNEDEHEFYITEKLDGSSATFYLKDGEFGVCSRNLDLIETEGNTFWKVARELKIEEKLRKLGFDLAIQGELIGEGIQGNPYKIKGHTVRFFTAFDIEEYRRLTFSEFTLTLEGLMRLSTVPIVALPGTMLPSTISELIEQAEGKSILNSQTEREGWVIRSSDNKISFKVISNKFLIKNK